MKWITVLAFCGIATCAYAQQQENEPMPSAREREIETKEQIEADNRKEERQRVEVTELPPRVKRTLRQNPVYEGWEEGTAYFDHSLDTYLIHITKDNSTKTYAFTPRGKPVEVGVDD